MSIIRGCRRVGFRRVILGLIQAGLLLTLAGCGYQLGERSASLPNWILTIYIAPWSNTSNELMLSSWITDELRREVLRRGGLRLADRTDADVILEGEVVAVSTSGLSYKRYDQAIERRLVVECSARLMDRRSGEVLWQTSNIVREESFLVGNEIMQTEGLKDEALQKLSRDVAEIIYHRITGVF